MLESQTINQIILWNKFIQNVDEIALSHIYMDNYDLLFDYGLRHTSDVQIVEDAIQEIFISIIKYRMTIGIVKNVQGYLISTFRRQLFLEINKQKKTISTEQLPEGFFDYFKSPEDNNIDNEHLEFLYNTIDNSISKISTKQKEILFLRFEQEISYDEISKILNISVESCYKSIYRTIKIIRSAAEKKLIKSGEIVLGSLSKKITKFKSQNNHFTSDFI